MSDEKKIIYNYIYSEQAERTISTYKLYKTPEGSPIKVTMVAESTDDWKSKYVWDNAKVVYTGNCEFVQNYDPRMVDSLTIHNGGMELNNLY